MTQANRPVRPWLYLDVDGVLNPFARIGELPGFDAHDVRALDGRVLTILLNPEHGAWLAELATVFDLAWATGWTDSANAVLAPLLGLPPLPVVRPRRIGFFGQQLDKLTPIRRHARGRPLAWIDDAQGRLARQWAQNRARRGRPTLLVHCPPETGLQREHIDRLLAFGQALAEGRRPAIPEDDEWT